MELYGRGLSQAGATKTDICQRELNWVMLKVYLQKHLKSSKHHHCIFTIGLSLFLSFFRISFFFFNSKKLRIVGGLCTTSSLVC